MSSLFGEVGVGDEVSFSARHHKRVGTIIMEIPSFMKGDEVVKKHLKNVREYDHSTLDKDKARDHISYVIAVEQKKGKPKLYWPKVEGLARASH